MLENKLVVGATEDYEQRVIGEKPRLRFSPPGLTPSMPVIDEEDYDQDEEDRVTSIFDYE